MPYVTSIERLAEARTRAEFVLMLLTEICGALPEVSEQRVRKLNTDQMKNLGKDLLRFRSLADLEAWLQQHAAADG